MKPSVHVSGVRLKMPMDVGVRGNITTVTLTRLGKIAPRRVGRKVTDFQNISHQFSFGVGGGQVMFLDSCTRRPSRVGRDIVSVHRLCQSGGVATIFRPRLCAHAHSFCGSFTSDLSLLSRIVLMSVCPTHRRPVPKMDDQLVCSGLHPNVRGDVYGGRRVLSMLGTGRVRMLVALKTKSVSGCIPNVYSLLSQEVIPSSGWFMGHRGGGFPCSGGGSSSRHRIASRDLPYDDYSDIRQRACPSNVP